MPRPNSAYRKTKDEIKQMYTDFRKKYLNGQNNVFGEIGHFDKSEKDSFKAQLLLVKEQLEAAMQALDGYEFDDNPVDPKNLRDYNLMDTEQKALKKYMSAVKDLDKNIAECFLFEESDNTPDLQQFYFDYLSLSGRIDKAINGNLQVPTSKLDPVTGKKNHFISNVKKTKNNDTGEVTMESIQPAIPKTNSGEKPVYETRDEPLFPHEPSPEDVKQGKLGDCYLITSLSSIALSNPEQIKDSMLDNGDGTVTVRFFNFKQEPVFVTVDKKVPVLFGEDAYGHGPLWVQIMEKAYVISGLHCILENGRKVPSDTGYTQNGDVQYLNDNASNLIEEGKLEISKLSYKNIMGGTAGIFMRDFLGGDKESLKPDTASKTVKGKKVQKAAPKKADGKEPVYSDSQPFKRKAVVEVKSVKRNDSPDPYDKAELELFDNMQKDFNKGRIITASSHINKNHSDTDYDYSNGIPFNHAYTVEDFKEDSGKKYIKVLNPHGTHGRGYDDGGKPIVKHNTKGESWVELRDFTNTFRRYFTVEYDGNYINRKNSLESGELKELYAEVIKEACSQLEKTDRQSFRNLVTNDDSRALIDAAIAARDEFNKEKPSPEAMKEKMISLFDKAKVYQRRRDEAVGRKMTDETKDRSVNRYQAADMLVKLEGIFNSNNAKEKFADKQIARSYALKEQLMNEDSAANKAKRAAVDSLKRDAEKQRAFENMNKRYKEQKAAAATEMEDAFKAKDSNTFLNAVTKIIYLNETQKKAAKAGTATLEKMLEDKNMAASMRKLKPLVNDLLANTSVESVRQMMENGIAPEALTSNFTLRFSDPKKVEKANKEYSRKELTIDELGSELKKDEPQIKL